ncbi:MAG: Gfo/Idh/MocA family oxidoreductase [Anaerolineae bacterium]|nr:Gfo/Idh/MocA family oxidoreductase [Anaerolineales bacterium]MCQ3976203.1 gfo/Idh/MocA family oxidoreductase [Anaerolineae bacterium]
MTDNIRWGILGTGVIARKFALGLKAAPGAELVAVGSRIEATADQFGDAFDVPRRHASYEALAHDPEVDVIYISTPHSLHKDNTLLCLEAGKAVLCEKPFAINAVETEAMIKLARQKKLFLMEAMWTRFLPAVLKVRQLIAEDAIGEVRMLMADLGFRAEFDPKSRLFDPALGGGALLDVGIYTVSFASMLLGTPVKVTSLAQLGQTGVDEQSAMLLSYAGGQLAVLAAAVRTDIPSEAIIMGTKGRIRVHAPIYCPVRLTLSRPEQGDEIIDAPLEGNGYNYQALEVMNCLRNGWLESATMPLDETLSIMRTMDEIRAPWGLKYPME